MCERGLTGGGQLSSLVQCSWPKRQPLHPTFFTNKQGKPSQRTAAALTGDAALGAERQGGGHQGGVLKGALVLREAGALGVEVDGHLLAVGGGERVVLERAAEVDVHL